ncbi:AAA family ATPase [Rhodococcus ruber]|uniref:AAA family ATPase n=1 Tax=Rhodococcus ruber TaxID=1830 RepID=A0ABT4MIA3_9NOCA|nr:AAA family ATPase [Rhodococcus ruber]MCZ4520722.1 AAA family ATPase [Rhodococcus ruber]
MSNERVVNITDLMHKSRVRVTPVPVPAPVPRASTHTTADPVVAEAIQQSSDPSAADCADLAVEVGKLRVRDRAREVFEEEKAVRLLALNADRAMDGLQFLTEAPEADPLWGEGDKVLMATGEGLMICGPQGVGKSTVVQQLVLARLGLRAPELFGLPVQPDPRPVLYLAMDRPPQIRRSLARMVDAVDPDIAEMLRQKLVVWKGPPPVDASRAPRVFADWVATIGRAPGLVVVDSLKDLASGLASDEVGSGINTAMQHILADGTEYVDLHHQRKANADNRKPDKLSDVYGSGWLTAGKGSVVLLWGDPGASTVELSHLKQPMDRVGPLIVDHAHGAGASVSADPTEQLVQLALAAGAVGITEAACVRAIFDEDRDDDGYTAHKSVVRRRLNRLTRDGVLDYRAGSKGGNGGGGNAATWTHVQA